MQPSSTARRQGCPQQRGSITHTHGSTEQHRATGSVWGRQLHKTSTKTRRDEGETETALYLLTTLGKLRNPKTMGKGRGPPPCPRRRYGSSPWPLWPTRSADGAAWTYDTPGDRSPCTTTWGEGMGTSYRLWKRWWSPAHIQEPACHFTTTV